MAHLHGVDPHTEPQRREQKPLKSGSMRQCSRTGKEWIRIFTKGWCRFQQVGFALFVLWQLGDFDTLQRLKGR
jgi:hypothetical protein